jgi:hypothetical protein
MNQTDTVLTPGQSAELDKVINSGRGPIWLRAAVNFTATAITSAMGGSIAFLAGTGGGFIAAGMSIQNDQSQMKTNQLHAACIKEVADTIAELKTTNGLGKCAMENLRACRASPQEICQDLAETFSGGSISLTQFL